MESGWNLVAVFICGGSVAFYDRSGNETVFFTVELMSALL